jgi:hypothetical protein
MEARANQGQEALSEDADEEYYVLPEEAFQYLPEEWRDQFQAIAEDGRAILKSVDPELDQAARISKSFATLVGLKYIRQRLADYRFSADMDAVLELDMLTTAFVVTYARLHHGGIGSGFSRDILPEQFRPVHDQIISLRNKRFAHNDEHPSVENAMEIGLKDGRFDIQFGLTLGFHIGGANEWHELVDFLDGLFVERLSRLLTRLKEKTGREWSLSPHSPSE